MNFTEVNGTALRYDLDGNGLSTLVLIHEMGGTLESWDFSHSRAIRPADRQVPRRGWCVSPLQRSLCAENDGRLRGQDAAIAMRQRDLAVVHLPRAAFAAQLADRLDQEEQPVHTRVTIRKPAAVGIDREAALGGDTPAADERAAFALLAEAKILKEQNGVDREGVIELDGVDIRRAELAPSA